MVFITNNLIDIVEKNVNLHFILIIIIFFIFIKDCYLQN